MARPYSFQDELTRLNAEREARERREEGQAAYRRRLDYRAGVATADDLIRRSGGCRSLEDRIRTLRTGARAQGDGTLAGRVAAGEIADTLNELEHELERQRPQRESDAAHYHRAVHDEGKRLAALARLEAIAAARRGRGRGYDPEREPER